jgi:predicted nucleotidyltransferase
MRTRAHAIRVRLFGLAARGDDRPDSDIDLLVDFDEDSSLFDLMRMSRELEALLGRAVDVVSSGGLKTRDRAILAESVDLWAAGTMSASPTSWSPPTKSARWHP